MYETLRQLGEVIYRERCDRDPEKIVEVISEEPKNVGSAVCLVVNPDVRSVKVEKVDADRIQDRYIFEYTHSSPAKIKKSYRLTRLFRLKKEEGGEGKNADPGEVLTSLISEARHNVAGILSDLERIQVSDEDFKDDLSMVLDTLRGPDAVNMSEFEVPKKGGILYTVGIVWNGSQRMLAESRGYAEYLWKVVRNETGSEGMRGVCYICGKEGEVCMDPNFLSRTPLKMFILDQRGFLAGGRKKMPESLRKSFAVCNDCAGYITLAYKYVEKKLSWMTPTGSRVYAFPRVDSYTDKLERVADVVRDVLQTGEGKEEASEVEKEAKQANSTPQSEHMIAEIEQEASFPITFVFGESNEAHFYTHKVIHDVPEFRVAELYKKLREKKNELSQTYKIPGKHFKLSLDKLAEIVPLAKSGEKVLRSEQELIASIFAAMLGQERLDRRILVEKAVLFAKLVYREDSGNYKFRILKGNKFERLAAGMVLFQTLIGMMRP